ncbi:AAA family ATPase [Methanolobus sp. WCC1]|jgi:exonuclease SbcC|uniref:ATP-binding protein n=1 Tax=unclassified Methanolobus TaxID=2629569 RepID=UPI002582EF0D|nr:AAA family ATPase [Methanolobus sp.]MDK2830336.1 repair protein SbcC/Rad50 [Methanolobus sp.]
MIIKKVRLSPFGGLSDREIVLEEGLNVIVGPNEAGKSTIYSGIQKVLFTPSKLNKRSFENEMKNHIPVGGDTSNVELQLLYNEELHTLKKSWGGSKFSQLVLPDGSLISNEDNVNEKLGTFMAAGPGTYKSVLMTYQSGLAKTLDELKSDSETLNSLGDVIRKAVFETEGVSVEKFNKKTDELYKDYFEHWDRIQNYPENNRGIENPYVKGVGKVLRAFYDKESLKSKYQNAIAYEEELDRLNRDLQDCDSELFLKDKYLKENKKIVEDARKRSIKISDFVLSENKIATFSEDNNEWITSENEIKELNGKIPLAEAKLAELKEEKKIAEIKAENEELVQKFTSLEKLKGEMDDAEEALKSVKKLDNTELKNIRDVFNDVDKLKASVEAGELRANFEAMADLKLNILKDLDDEYTKELILGESLVIEAGGKIKIKHSDWKLEISSGAEEIDKVVQNFEVAKKKKIELLTNHDLKSLDEAEEINKQYNEAVGAFENATKNFEKELGDDSYEAILEKIEHIGVDPTLETSTRPLATIVEEVTRLDIDVGNYKNQLQLHTEKVNELVSKHKSKSDLFLELGKISLHKDELEKEINSLSALPEGMDSDEDFISEYESVEDEFNQYTENRYKILQHRLEIEKDASDESAEELEDRKKEAEAAFNKVLRKAEAIARIKEVAQDILEDMDSDTYGDLKKDLEEYISFMTDGRHSSVQMDEGKSVPCGFVRDDGAVLDYDLLSAGTKDVLSLALRLSMAKYFLQEANGFLIMDDPFVDMDPERQQRTGELLRKFAEDKQVIIFTCHPAHADSLGGKQIVLS